MAVTGVDAFERVTGNIRRAIDAGLNIRLMITHSSYMSPWVERTMRLASSFGAEVLVSSVLIEPNANTGRHKDEFDISNQEYMDIRKARDELLSPNPRREEEELYGPSDRPDVSEKGLHCNAGRTGFAINWDGTMAPCLSFPRTVICEDGAVSKRYQR